jgi:predicted metal-dependent hydrolase
MVEFKTVQISGIGRVNFVPSQRAKYINITVRPFKGVRVAVPRGVAIGQAREFALSRQNWIKKHIKEARQLEKAHLNFLRRSEPIDRTKARQRLVRKLDALAANHGFTYNKVFIRNQKTRWGSCSAQNNLSLNINLIWLPDELITYVILHELVHTRIKNHSAMFWNALEKIKHNAKSLRRELGDYSFILL